MNLNPIRAWWAECKLWIIGILLVAAVGYHFYYGHEKFKAGKAAGDKEVAALKANYNRAYVSAQAAARTMQSIEDAQELADTNARLARQQQALDAVSSAQRRAEASADAFKAKLDDLRKHDPNTARWLDARVPDGVRTAGQG